MTDQPPGLPPQDPPPVPPDAVPEPPAFEAPAPEPPAFEPAPEAAPAAEETQVFEPAPEPAAAEAPAFEPSAVEPAPAPVPPPVAAPLAPAAPAPVAPVPPPAVAPAPPPAAQAAPQPAPAQPYGYVPASGRPGPVPGVFFAGHPARLIAWILDGIILSVVVTLLYIVIGLVGGLISVGSNELAGLVLLVGWIAVLIVGIVWYPYWWSKSGQSPGKKLMHLKVVRAQDGELLSFGGGFLRLIGYWVSAFVFYIGFLWILVDGKRQGWADKIASTYVIEVP